MSISIVTNAHSQEPTAASRISAADTIVGSPNHTHDFSKFTGSNDPQTVSPNGGTSASADFQAALDESGPTIPPVHDGRTLVLCFDGTGDQFDLDNSNIVQLFSMLKKDDYTKQRVYYQAGIGTYESPKVATPFVASVSKTLDEMIAWNLDGHLMDGYEFLMQNYTRGDRICIFGFSRGAYLARSLAGMLHKVGLLPASNYQQVPFAYKMYTNDSDEGWKQSTAFKHTFSMEVFIEFVGVWDTVNSVGLIPRRLPFTVSNTIVKTFRHAVSLDEHRVRFKPNLWNRPTPEQALLGPPRRFVRTHKDTHNHKQTLAQHERQYSGDQRELQTDVDEVWFSGCHCDVGGGSVANDTPNSLARIPLRWMVRECFKTNSGIMFDPRSLWDIGIDPATLWPIVLPRPASLPVGSARIQSRKDHVQKKDESHVVGTEEQEELKDALTPIYDQLVLAWYWWILEILPNKHRKQGSSWLSGWSINLGKPRAIPLELRGVKVHRSVKMRMEAEGHDGKKYKPKAKLVNPTWVD